MTDENPTPVSMRVHWFDHVRKIRKKLTRETKQAVTHREAMQKASVSWPEIKEKLLRKKAREQKREAQAAKKAAKVTKKIKVIKPRPKT